VSGCSITTTSEITDFDRDATFEQYRTFYWSDDFQVQNGKEDPIFYNSLVDKRLKKAIKDQMTRRGYTLDKVNPDLLVNTHVVVREKNTSQSSYPGGYYPFYFGLYPQYGTVTTTRQSEGGVVIELIDKAKHQLVWQGYAPEVLQAQTLDKAAEINDSVALIFAAYKHRAGESTITSDASDG
jgi:hypothetical protein